MRVSLAPHRPDLNEFAIFGIWIVIGGSGRRDRGQSTLRLRWWDREFARRDLHHHRLLSGFGEIFFFARKLDQFFIGEPAIMLCKPQRFLCCSQSPHCDVRTTNYTPPALRASAIDGAIVPIRRGNRILYWPIASHVGIQPAALHRKET